LEDPDQYDEEEVYEAYFDSLKSFAEHFGVDQEESSTALREIMDFEIKLANVINLSA